MDPFSPEGLAALPPELRAKLRAGLLKHLSEIGVTPQVDAKTGEMVVDLAAVARAYGMTEAEMQQHCRDIGADRHLRRASDVDLKPFN